MRRAVSLLLCVALVSAQWLSGEQCHAVPSECSTEHGARPHIHVGSGGDHHHHGPSLAEDSGTTWCGDSAEHDDDIVVLPELTSSLPSRPVASQILANSDIPLAACSALVALMSVAGDFVTTVHPPPIVPGCALYLRTLSIRC